MKTKTTSLETIYLVAVEILQAYLRYVADPIQEFASILPSYKKTEEKLKVVHPVTAMEYMVG